MDEFGRFVGLTILITTMLVIVVNLAAISAFVVALLAFLLLAFKILLVAFVTVGVVIGVVWAYKMLAQTLDDMRRSQDGTFPMVRKKVYLTWWGRLLRIGPSRERYVIPELTTGVFGFDETGEPVLIGNPTGERTEVRALYQQGKNLQAATPGDRTYIQGGLTKPPTITKAAVASSQNNRALLTVEDDEIEPTIPERAEALKSLNPVAKRLIAMGDERTMVLGIDEYGRVATVNVEEQNHLRVHGSPQKGKSSLTRFLGVQVVTRGWHLVVLDRRNGKDWLTMSDAAEICNSIETDLFAEQLRLLVEEYLRRDAMLGQYRAPNIQALPDDVRPPRVMAVVEELGVQMVNARSQSGKLYKSVEGMLRRLTAEAGATGIHMVVIDHDASNLPGIVRTAIDTVVVFPVGEYRGQSLGPQFRDSRYLPKGSFMFGEDGNAYKAPYVTVDEAGRLVSGRRAPLEIINGAKGWDRRGEISVPSETVIEGEIVGDETEMGPTDYQKAAIEWIANNPGGTQKAMREALGISKGYASELWRRVLDADGDLHEEYLERLRDR